MTNERSEHDSATGRRRWSPVVVTSVAAAVLLAGGGGYWASAAAGSSGGTGRSSASDNGSGPPPLTLDAAAPGGGPQGIAPGEPDPSGVVYRAAGPLPEGPEKAPVYRAEGTVTAADVAKLANAVGLTGTPRPDGTSWKVGTDHDGSGPLLRVTRQAPGSWTFARFGSGGSDNCPRNKPCGIRIAPGGAGRAVSEKAAKAAAAPVLEALGQQDAELDAHQVTGSVRVVEADPEIGGLPTRGWMTGLRIGPDGELVGGSGQLQAPVRGTEYPLVGAAQALKGLNTPAQGASRGSTGDCAVAEPFTQDGTGAKKPSRLCLPLSSRAPGPRTPGPRTSQPRTVIVDHAELGLATQLVGGRQALVPSWLFAVRQTGNAMQSRTVTATAVEPRYLVRPTPPAHPLPGQPDGRKVQSYSTAGRTLTVHFWGGVCGTYAARASENSGSVRVSISGPGKQEPGKICIMPAKDLTRTVTLDRPLGNRRVVDASSGDTVPRK